MIQTAITFATEGYLIGTLETKCKWQAERGVQPLYVHMPVAENIQSPPAFLEVDAA